VPVCPEKGLHTYSVRGGIGASQQRDTRLRRPDRSPGVLPRPLQDGVCAILESTNE